MIIRQDAFDLKKQTKIKTMFRYVKLVLHLKEKALWQITIWKFVYGIFAIFYLHIFYYKILPRNGIWHSAKSHDTYVYI